MLMHGEESLNKIERCSPYKPTDGGKPQKSWISKGHKSLRRADEPLHLQDHENLPGGEECHLGDSAFYIVPEQTIARH